MQQGDIQSITDVNRRDISLTARETHPDVIADALLGIVRRRVLARGEVDFPCIPSLRDEFVSELLAMWGALGKSFSDPEKESLCRVVDQALTTGFEASPYARMVVSYEANAPPLGVRYAIRLKENTIEQHYEHWLLERKGPLFGESPDAMVLEISASLGDPKKAPVLDIGAGTGRNAIPLARRGHPTTGVELVAAFADEMKAAAAREHLPLDVVVLDALEPEFSPPRGHYRLIVFSEVASHFRDVAELRTLFVKFADALAPGGIVLANFFLALDGYEPDDVAVQVSEVSWSRIFTRRDLAFITTELPFDLASETSVHDHEKAHLPPEEWPPTNWFADWSQGRNVFDLPPGAAPIELRWMTFRRR